MYGKKNVIKCLLLTFVTLGVYGIYWYKQVTDEVRYFADDDRSFNGTWALVVSILTFGIYTYYWAFRHDNNMLYACKKRDIEYTPNFIVYEFFVLTGLYFVPLMIMQHYINEMVESETVEIIADKENLQEVYDYWQKTWVD